VSVFGKEGERGLRRTAMKKIPTKLNMDRIIQFSSPRSGSTLVFNILKELFPKTLIVKTHKCIKDNAKYPTVATCRHPLDCIASSIQRYQQDPTDEVLDEHIRALEKHGIWDVLRIKDDPNVLMLRYEEFNDNYDHIYNRIEQFFSTKIELSKRQAMTTSFQKDKIEKLTEKYSSFKEYDPETHWHGLHISKKFKGGCYYYNEFFLEDQISYMKSVFIDYLNKFGYS
jgi:hypothetical protein